MRGVESLRIQSFRGFWKSRKIPGLDFWESLDRDFEKIPGSRDIPGSRRSLIKTKRTLKHWLIKRQEQVGHSTTRSLSDLDTHVTRTELDECLDICMRHTCIACKFCKWRWAPMQFGTLSDYGVRDYILVTEFSSALFFYLIIYPLSMVGHIHVNICLGLKRAENP